MLVLRLDLDWLNHSELAVARSAGRWGVPVWGLRKGGVSVAASRFSRGRVAFDTTASEDERLTRLAQIGQELSGPVLLPIDDDASVFAADHAERLREVFRMPAQQPALTRQLADKGELHRLCAERGVPTPGAYFPRSREDVDDYARSGAFPVVVKRMAAWRPARRERRSVVVASTPRELAAAYERMESPQAPNVMLQEYVPGGAGSAWIFNGYFDHASACLVGFTGVKLRQSGREDGATSLALCRPNRELRSQAVQLLEGLGYRGLVDVDYRYDPRDGRFKLLDVNPRLGSSFRLFVNSEGIDVFRALYLDLTGRPVPAGEDCGGRKWMVENFDAVAALRAAREGALTPRGWLRSLRGVNEAAWFAADDPLPFAALCLEYPLQALRRRPRSR